MEANLHKYFRLMAAHREAVERAFVCRARVAQERNIGLEEAQDDQEFVRLSLETQRLQREAEALSPYAIRENLKQFGIEDMKVTGLLMGSGLLRELELGRGSIFLSDLCGLRFYGFAARLGRSSSDIGQIAVEKDGVRIGQVDSDGIFHYEAAPDTRTALGWWVCTDGGRVRIIEEINLEQVAQAILDTIRSSGRSSSAFFDCYLEQLGRVLTCGSTSRFADGFCAAGVTLWRVATRELGEEHPGHPYAY